MRVAPIVLCLFVGANALLRTQKNSQKVGTHSSGLDEVIDILLGMMKDFRSQMTGDKSSWEEYGAWSDSEEADKTNFVQEQQALVMSKTALKSANQDAVQKLTAEISTLNGDILSTKKSIAELTKLRKEEHFQHEEELADLTKTIDAVNKAIEILEGHYSASGAVLSEIKKRVQYALSLSDNGRDEQKQSALTNLMQNSGPDWLSVDGSKYSSYESQAGGGGVVGTLNDLRSTLDQNKQESIEKENESRRVYEDTKATKEGEIGRMTEELGNKGLAKTNAESTITSCTAAIDQAEKNIADGKSFLQVLLADRAKFQEEFNQRTVMRNDEMAATQAALDALQAVSAGAKSGVSAAVLLQLMSKDHGKKCPKCQKETERLVKLAQKLHSTELLQVISELTQRTVSKTLYSPDGFEPVKDLLRQLITRLEEEQSAETSHHDWCETEKSSSEAAQREREATIKDLQTEVEFLTTNTAQLKTELTFLADEYDRVKGETEHATSIRSEAHEVFAKAKSDHDEVIGAIEKAMEALGDKYSLLQKHSAITRKNVMKVRTNLWAKHQSKVQVKSRVKGKASPFADYQSGSGAAGSATEMLEDLLSRYSTARTQLVGDEEAAVAAYKQLMATNKQFMKDTQNTLNSKMSERRGKLNKMKNSKDDLKTNFVELQELGQYLKDLRPSCDDIRSTFEERKRRREAEIAALKECLEVLSDPSAMSDV